jgi:uncharacterized DUF497 family protein
MTAMEKRKNTVPPLGRSFGKTRKMLPSALEWNADVERRRREHHERRCAEDPVYKRAYEREQELKRRIQKMHSMAMAQLQDIGTEPENVKCQQAKEAVEEPQRVMTHEEAMQMRAMLKELRDRNLRKCGLHLSEIAEILTDPGVVHRLEEMAQEAEAAQEIRSTDKRFDEELIRMSGFEW